MDTDAHWLTLLEVTGEDRETFLQGQLTQDLATLTAASPVRFAASCDAKGRVLAVLTLIRDGDRLFAALRADRADDWLAHVLRYRLRAKVDLVPARTHRLVAHGTRQARGASPADGTPSASSGPQSGGVPCATRRWVRAGTRSTLARRR